MADTRETKHHNKPEEHKPTIVAEVDDTPHEEAVEPIAAIIRELKFVAEGGSVAVLKSKVQEVMPRDKAAARALYNKLVRMRDAAEAMVGSATEVVAYLEN